MTHESVTLTQAGRPACLASATAQKGASRAAADRGDALAAILFEQLRYLIEYSDQEQERLQQVAKILTAPFSEAARRS